MGHKTTTIQAVVKSFIMQLLLFAIVGLAYATQQVKNATEGPTPPWANETKYGLYQDAWKSLNQSNTTLYWLVKATFNNDNASWGENFRCLSVQETNHSQATNSVVSVFKFQNDTSEGSALYTVEEKVQAIFQYNYTKTRNAIQYTLEDNRTLIDTLIFSDEICDIFSVPYMNNGSGCELWVRDEYVDKVPSCCLFIYDFFCTNVTSYELYQNKNCTKENRTSLASNKEGIPRLTGD
uniref:Lipocal-1 1 n=1 Tax=Amblyomma americanum TaxID=6943 RepID=A0A0C9SFH6_AMBAM